MNDSAATPSAGAAFGRWRVFPAVALGVIMATLDASVVNIALPTLQREFATTLTTVVWVMLAYSVTVTGLLLTSGRLADLQGRRRVYGIGLVVFTLASALCGTAQSVHWLIAARVLQGIGAALVSANGSALLVSAFPAEERGKALGAFGAMVGVGLAIGSPLGGIVIHHASWRWLFFVNLPLGVLTLWLLNSRVQDDRLVQELPGGPWVLRRPAAGAPRLDVWAAATWCGALAALMLAISRGPAVGWANPQTLGLFAAMAVLLLLFVVVERRTPHPMLPLQILFGPLGAAVLLTLLSQAMTMAVGFHMPMYLEEVLHFDTQKSGMWNAILPLFALFCAPLAGRLSDRIGARVLTTLGMALACAGFVILAGLGVDTPPWHLFAGLGVMGAGLGLFSVPNASALLSLVPREQLGIASGLQGTTRNLGFSSGIALMGVLVASGYRAHTGHAMAGTGASVSPVGFAAATHDAYLVMAVIAVVATLLAAVQDRKAPVRKDPAPAR